MGLKKVLSITSPIIPVKRMPTIKAIQNGNPRSTASALINPAPTTTNAG